MSDRTIKLFEKAEEEARGLRHDSIRTCHLLSAMAADVEGVPARVMRNFGLDLFALRASVLILFPRGKIEIDGSLDLDSGVRMVLGLAEEEAEKRGSGLVEPEDILLAIARVRDCSAMDVLSFMVVGSDALRREVERVLTPIEA